MNQTIKIFAVMSDGILVFGPLPQKLEEVVEKLSTNFLNTSHSQISLSKLSVPRFLQYIDVIVRFVLSCKNLVSARLSHSISEFIVEIGVIALEYLGSKKMEAHFPVLMTSVMRYLKTCVDLVDEESLNARLKRLIDLMPKQVTNDI